MGQDSNKMTKSCNKPVYEIVKVLPDRIFIIELSDYHYNLYDFVTKLKKEFPNRRIIINGGINRNKNSWYETRLAVRTSPFPWPVNVERYQEDIPDIKPWDKILKHD